MSKETKPPVEFALDNRQIFFLFFGLSVVGCFVFALGVTVGRADLGVPGAEGPVIAEKSADLDALAEDDAIPIEAPDTFAFKDGIAEPATAGLPETRDPETPPRDEKAVKAERAAASGASKPRVAKRPLPAVLSKADPEPEPAAKAPKETVKVAAKEEAPKAEAPAAETAKGEGEGIKDDTVMASGTEKAEAAPTAAKKRVFTLQLKAYADAADAEKMADKLRRNGHDVRVEVGDVQGRSWHRVRIGEFTQWDKALEAKSEFEKREEIIAYVVPK